jgi:hypothetical protein
MRKQKFTPKHIERWRSQLDTGEINAVAEMLEKFGSDLYSVHDAMPLKHMAMVGS